MPSWWWPCKVMAVERCPIPAGTKRGLNQIIKQDVRVSLPSWWWPCKVMAVDRRPSPAGTKWGHK
eukprot:1144255-Pelagomonas_calceolata.AAC.11